MFRAKQLGSAYDWSSVARSPREKVEPEHSDEPTRGLLPVVK